MTGDNKPIRIAIIGAGKIARDKHVPTMEGDPRWSLVATVDPEQALEGVPNFITLDLLFSGGPKIDAVAICTPPLVRPGNAIRAIAAGVHVLLEKPPAPTVAALAEFRELASQRGVSLYAAWHSRHAPMVPAARAWLAGRRIKSGSIVWHEDVRRWHPRQEWLWAPGGFGVFDPGINALSILTQICPLRVIVESAEFEIPENRQSPIAARLQLMTGAAKIEADFDFRETLHESRTIEIEDEYGDTLSMRNGGRALSIDGGSELEAPDEEYKGVYRRFADLISAGQSDVDATPLQLAADAFRIAQNALTEPFEW